MGTFILVYFVYMNREFFKCDVNIFCLYTAFLDRYVHIIVMKCSLKQCLIIAQYLKLIREIVWWIVCFDV